MKAKGCKVSLAFCSVLWHEYPPPPPPFQSATEPLEQCWAEMVNAACGLTKVTRLLSHFPFRIPLSDRKKISENYLSHMPCKSRSSWILYCSGIAKILSWGFLMFHTLLGHPCLCLTVSIKEFTIQKRQYTVYFESPPVLEPPQILK